MATLGAFVSYSGYIIRGMYFGTKLGQAVKLVLLLRLSHDRVAVGAFLHRNPSTGYDAKP
jgi:hypothetical protein